MGKTLEDAGMLVKDENGELKVSDSTARKFLKVRNNLIESGEPGLPFPCISVDEKSRNSTLKIFWEDKEKYPSFFKKWIDGILLNELKNLNVDGNVALPVYDPIAIGGALQIEKLPNLPLPALIGALAMPPGSPLPLLMLNMKFKDAISASIKIPDLLKPPIPPIPKLPVPIDIEFPTLAFEPIEFSLLGKHIELNLALPKMIKGLLGEIATIEFLANLTPIGLFELSCKVVDANKPLPPATNEQTDMGSYNTNFAAISSVKAEALAISMLGSIIGSASTGITGHLGALGEHKDPPPSQDPLGSSTQLESPTVSYMPPREEQETPPAEEIENNAVSGIWTPSVPKQLFNNSSLSAAIASQSSYANAWNVIMDAKSKAMQAANKNYTPSKKQYSGDPRPFTVLHAQIVQGIVATESANGQAPSGGKTTNNWAGLQCADSIKNTPACPQGTYITFASPVDSVQKVCVELSNRGGSHAIKTNSVSVACYLMKNGPADRDEPFKTDPNDDRATFYRIYYSLRRPPIYYSCYTTKENPAIPYSYVNSPTYKKYDGKVTGWLSTPDASPGGTELFSEDVKRYAESSLLHIQASLYYNGIPWAMPKGTFEDAHLWWVTKFRPIKKLDFQTGAGDWNDEFVLNKPKKPESSVT